MPIFEYVCQQCRHHFEAIVLGNKKAACPKCESKRLSQQLSSFAVRGEKSQEAGSSGQRLWHVRRPSRPRFLLHQLGLRHRLRSDERGGAEPALSD